jgi:hypothetical protein
MKKLMDCKTYEPAGASCARITNSSVVVPMISFARFNGTHRILSIESWVGHFCKNEQTLEVNGIKRTRTLHVPSLKKHCRFLIMVLFLLLFLCLMNLKGTYPRNNAKLF